MTASVYTPHLFGPPSREPLEALASDKHASRNFGDSTLPDLLCSHPQSAIPVDELDLAQGFALEQHAPATRKAYRSDFALFASWLLSQGP